MTGDRGQGPWLREGERGTGVSGSLFLFLGFGFARGKHNGEWI